MKIEYITEKELSVSRFSTSGPLMVMPYTNRSEAEKACTNAARRSGLKEGLILAVDDQARKGFIEVVNTAFARTDSPWFGYFAQDAFAGRSWLAIATQTLQTSNASLIAFNDGKWAGLLAAFGLARRSWAAGNYAGNFFHAGYLRHYADAELTLLAMQDKQYTYNANSVLVEVDWKKDEAPVHPQDKQLFNQRKANGFGNRVDDVKLLSLFY
ncbi:MAG TPA: hypothetical protein VFV39_07280 [Limnobacter sp.]|nr:hypothetical protein [Limnobacter sp.]